MDDRVRMPIARLLVLTAKEKSNYTPRQSVFKHAKLTHIKQKQKYEIGTVLSLGWLVRFFARTDHVETFSLHIMFARMGIAIDPFGVYVCAPRSILVFISFTICYFKRVLNLVYLVDVFRSYTSHIFRLFPRAPCNRISRYLLYFSKCICN